ncbi:MAG: putative membrane-bound dehydrogenase-like protein [Halioglobus sp.]|jgi:putative membrane-bound dehydrogenase-like protein
MAHLYVRLLYLSFFLTLLSSCAPEVKIDISEFIIQEGYKIELVANEPLLDSPVATVQDINGRLWVVEMPGYMRDIDGNGEDIRDGRIVILEDTDADGQMDKRTIFLDGLLNPRAISLVYDGILYTDSTALIWTSIKDDLPGKRELVDSIYVIGGNIEHQPNGLFYNLDNWIYSAKSNARYKRIVHGTDTIHSNRNQSYMNSNSQNLDRKETIKRRKGNWIKEATTFRGQWGISSDHVGRLIYNHNSAPIIGDRTLPNMLINNKFQKVNHGTGIYYTNDMSINAAQATSVNRGYEDGVLDSLGRVQNYTSACAPHMYYGTGLKASDYSDFFVCAPEANLISKYDIDHINQSASKGVGQEFLVSKDESFRPVNLMTGYDGCLYITDLRKGVIQHTAYLSSYLREKILAKGLDKINGNGRIYKVTAIAKSNTVYNNKKRMSSISDSLWTKVLLDSNYNVRLLGQQKLIQLKASFESPNELLHKFSYYASDAPSTVHALWTLDELGLLNAKILLNKNAKKFSLSSLPAIVPLWRKYDTRWVYEADRQFIDLYRELINLNDRNIDFQLAPNLAAVPHYWKDLIRMARKYSEDKLITESIISGLTREEEFAKMLTNETKLGLLKTQLQKVLENKNNNNSQAPKLYSEPFDDTRTNGLKIFKSYCASCHGIGGRGQKNVAPSLIDSKILVGPEKEIARIILHGNKNKSDKYQIQMPSYINDPNMSNQDVNDVIDYLLSTYARRWITIKADEIQKIRTEK